jgi:hypothetical protein
MQPESLIIASEQASWQVLAIETTTAGNGCCGIGIVSHKLTSRDGGHEQNISVRS